jgi:hypothetical protein
MLSRNFTQTGSGIVLLIGQIIVLLICIGYIQYIYTANILPDKEAKESYQQSQCFLTSKKLSSKGHIVHQYRADFLISYQVNGVQYNRWVSGNGLDMSFSHNASDQEDVLSEFDVGGNYNCWYNPNNPQLAILVLRHNWLSTFPLMLPSVIGVITLYYLLKNIAQLIASVKAGIGEKREEKKEQKSKKP